MFHSSPAAASNHELTAKEVAVHTLIALPSVLGQPDLVFIGTRSPFAYVATLQGRVIRSFSFVKANPPDFVCATVSPQGTDISPLLVPSNVLL